MPLGNSGTYTGWGYNRLLDKYMTRQADHATFMGKELTSKGSKVVGDMLGPPSGRMAGGKMSNIGFGFKGMALSYAIGVPMKLRRGMSLPSAMALDTAESVAFIAAPEIFAYRAAYQFAKQYPEMRRAKEQQRDYITNYSFLGGDYIDAESNYKSRARAMEQIQRSRQNLSTNIGREAKRYHR